MLSNIINYAGMFVIAVMITRLSGVDALGEFTYIFAISSVLSVISEFGLSQLLIRKINSDRPQVLSLIKNTNRFKLILSVSCVIIALTVLTLINGLHINSVYIAGLAIIIPKAFQSTYESAIRALMKQTLPAVLKSVNTFIQIILAYQILRSSGNLFYVFLMILAAESISAIAYKISAANLWRRAGISFTKPVSFSQFKSILSESFPFFGSNFLALSIPRVIIIILGNLTSQVSVGIFSAASRFSNGIGLFSGALYNTIYPAMTDPAVSVQERYIIAKKFTVYAFLVGLCFSIGIYFSAAILIDITFKIPEAIPILKLMGFTVIPIMVYSIIQPFLFSVKQEKFILKIYILVWSLNIITGIFAIHHHNYLGAALNSVIIEYLLLISFVYKFINCKPE